MRKTLNDNPMIAIAVVAVLGIGVAFMLMSQLSKKGAAPETTSTADPAAAATAAVPATTGVPGTTTAAPSTAAPAVSAASPATGSAAEVGAFQPGPGLPKAVVDAYRSGDVVALLVVKRNGIDDHAVQKSLGILRRAPNLALFQTAARHVARYSRIAEGVDLNRVPALVVMRPKDLTKGAPTASVFYGFRSAEAIAQAFRDASYKGPENLPFSPR
jgi:hypothetical protein